MTELLTELLTGVSRFSVRFEGDTNRLTTKLVWGFHEPVHHPVL
jgi:hypothetical protein